MARRKKADGVQKTEEQGQAEVTEIPKAAAKPRVGESALLVNSKPPRGAPPRKLKVPEIRDAHISMTIETGTGSQTFECRVPNHWSNILDRTPAKIAGLLFQGLRKQFPQVTFSAVSTSSKSDTSD